MYKCLKLNGVLDLPKNYVQNHNKDSISTIITEPILKEPIVLLNLRYKTVLLSALNAEKKWAVLVTKLVFLNLNMK
jgi:hypothetical protein